MKARIRHAFRLSRALVGIAEPADPPPSTSAASSSATDIVPSAGTTTDLCTVSLGETILQGNESKIKVMSDEEHSDKREVYFAKKGRYPPEDEAVAIEQLSAFKTIIYIPWTGSVRTSLYGFLSGTAWFVGFVSRAVY